MPKTSSLAGSNTFQNKRSPRNQSFNRFCSGLFLTNAFLLVRGSSHLVVRQTFAHKEAMHRLVVYSLHCLFHHVACEGTCFQIQRIIVIAGLSMVFTLLCLKTNPKNSRNHYNSANTHHNSVLKSFKKLPCFLSSRPSSRGEQTRPRCGCAAKRVRMASAGWLTRVEITPAKTTRLK